MTTNGIKFGDLRTTTTVELPSFKGSEVEVYNSLTVWDQREINTKFPDATNAKSPDAFWSVVEMIVKSIKHWNFYDDDAMTIETAITSENIAKLSQDDLVALFKWITGKDLLRVDNSIADATTEKKN